MQQALIAKDKGADGFTSAEKCQRVVKSAALNEQALGEFCRRRGVFAEPLAAWREEQAERRELSKRVKHLEYELRCLEKALAEAAALRVPQSPGDRGEREDASSTLRGDES
jgi:hypothetical protein